MSLLIAPNTPETASFDDVPADARQQDLRSSNSPWQCWPHDLRDPAPEADIACEVLVVGAGITGALAAEALSARGHDVVVVDRGPPARGSTAASTAMLQWEIDTPLTELAERIGFDRAADVYRRSLSCVSGLAARTGELGVACGFRPRQTLYLAGARMDPARLCTEHALRMRAGLPGDMLDHPALLGTFGIDRAAALLSPGSAEADPVLLAQGMLACAKARGVRVIEGDAHAFDQAGVRVGVTLSTGRVIEARRVVLATGYAMPDFVPATIHSISTSWAIITEPQDTQALWTDGVLIWEADEPYLYARTTVGGRIVIGGEDEPGHDEARRDAAMPEKVASLTQKLGALWPIAHRRVETCWAGAFGESEDGLPLIGPVPGHDRILCAYGYGGNGITFSFLAAQAMAELVIGERPGWLEPFAPERAG
jgi:glycine/D-amino acid oxidase-like deaminating enzyme